MREVILLLGGTKEAAEIATRLVAEKPDARIISSLAGRTKEPIPLSGETRIGGFGGTEGLAKFILENEVTKLIDATHPFATNISRNAQIAASKTGIPLEEIERPAWQKIPGDNWIEVHDLQSACDAIPSGTRVLLALGRQHIGLFQVRADVHFLVRMVDEPSFVVPLPKHTLEIGKPGDLEDEIALLQQHRISHIVCRNSGGKGAYAKIEAARALNIPVIMVARQ